MKFMTLLSKVSLDADGGRNGVNRECNPLRRLCVSKAEAGKIAFSAVLAQPSLCGDRACQRRGTQVNLKLPCSICCEGCLRTWLIHSFSGPVCSI